MQEPSYGLYSVREISQERQTFKPTEEALLQKFEHSSVVRQLLLVRFRQLLLARGAFAVLEAEMVGPEDAGVSYLSQGIRFRRCYIHWSEAEVEVEDVLFQYRGHRIN